MTTSSVPEATPVSEAASVATATLVVEADSVFLSFPRAPKSPTPSPIGARSKSGHRAARRPTPTFSTTFLLEIVETTCWVVPVAAGVDAAVAPVIVAPFAASPAPATPSPASATTAFAASPAPETLSTVASLATSTESPRRSFAASAAPSARAFALSAASLALSNGFAMTFPVVSSPTRRGRPGGRRRTRRIRRDRPWRGARLASPTSADSERTRARRC